ncbi:hypothetical protein QE422_003889 [Chryseobacterium sp. SORGH_AS 447]|uniref:hypothetical protein n=1 Tax=Chryseobacterium sp. SORGH_AS_0447 TaxID=3041769 RepID=UPI00278B84FF|nr:hypothetical protein [Chryseobacterium sp. SORGH_AS_0447]MDQ1163521.1 hypothetical protein [Chryseobacterium sp. SORGH_AS_0447]
MDNIKFSSEGKTAFYLSFALGTLILISFLLTRREFLLTIGFYYVLAAAVINIIVFFYELTLFISNIADNKPHGNSAVLLLLNIPISIIYFLAVINCIS